MNIGNARPGGVAVLPCSPYMIQGFVRFRGVFLRVCFTCTFLVDCGQSCPAGHLGIISHTLCPSMSCIILSRYVATYSSAGSVNYFCYWYACFCILMSRFICPVCIPGVCGGNKKCRNGRRQVKPVACRFQFYNCSGTLK